MGRQSALGMPATVARPLLHFDTARPLVRVARAWHVRPLNVSPHAGGEDELELDCVLRVSPLASFQPLGDSAVVLRIDSGQLYSANTTAQALLSAMDGERTLAEITSLLLDDFHVDRDVLERDLLALSQQLLDDGIVERARSAS